MKLYLASQSPRRRQLLEEADFAFEVIIPDAESEDERRTNETPADYVCRLALQKAESAAKKINSSISADIFADGICKPPDASYTIIACDTVAVCNEIILGKPLDRQDAERMLKTLRGQKHSVLSGICVMTIRNGKTETVVKKDETVLVMKNISDIQMTEYLNSGNWQGKAGAFGYQDGHDWLQIISGSESNVVGLPMELLIPIIKYVFLTMDIV